MRFATRALILALATLVLCTVVPAQTLRSENDPRNLSPAVGTGGPVGGPTGLFTVYDGQTIRKGEFTFSIAYSNYDRDPGDVDISDVPLSFNVGLNDHVELFFKTNGYRKIEVNSPQNLSSFYLPNSQAYPAIILAPSGPNVGNIAGQTLFRPAFNQPFVAFPFIGGSAGTYGLTAGVPGGLFGFPGFSAQIGTPTGGGGNFSGASSFPGMGSPFGSILPGVVLATAQLPCTALTGGCNPPGFPNPQTVITVPTSFTSAPSYLPDAPFVNRFNSNSSFTDFVLGAKIRFTGPDNPLGVGIIPFYRWYPDNADDAKGFNQMQRGAGPGGNIGDFGVIGFIDGRLSEHVNLSANLGYILNSNPKSKAMGNAVLLDRPNEVLSGIAADFPINKYVQIIGELRATQYVSSHTPNSFPNNPIDTVGGVKFFPQRWWGIGVAYRRHLNQTDASSFKTAADFNAQISNLSGVFVPNRGIIIVPGTTRPATANGLPLGFRFSDDPNGFIVQFWAGHRNARIAPPPPNQAPTVAVSASSSTITLPCAEGSHSDSCTPSATRSVDLTADARDADNDTLLYTWSVTGGKLSGDGRTVNWDLSGVNPGTYTATVEVADGCCHTVPSSTTVTVAECTSCVPNLVCPTVSVSCPSDVDQGSPITYTASASGDASVTFNWSVSAGTISSGQGTSSITVDTAGLGGQTVTATVELGGLDPACSRTASCTTSIRAPNAPAVKFDEYGNIRFNDEKARLDNYAIQLQNQPGSQGFIVVYGACAGEAQARADRAKDYLVNTRGIDAGRLVTIDGGCRSDLAVELWVVPTGATPPAASTDNIVSPCPNCKAAPRRRARRRGRDE